VPFTEKSGETNQRIEVDKVGEVERETFETPFILPFVSQLLMKEVVNDENKDLLFLIRVSSTVDYGRTFEV
jgi:hypothetical protein